MPRLEQWSIFGVHVMGYVYNDERFSDGSFVHTSSITRIDFEEGVAKILTTRDTTYELGKRAV